MSHRKLIISKDRDVLRPAIFCDRDGVLIKDCHYISNRNDVSILKGSKELLKLAKFLDWHFIIITNQSGISRGIFSWADYDQVTNRMIRLIGGEKLISGIYANGYGPESNDSWRKPNIGMIQEAELDFNIDMEKSILIGDRLTDLIAGYHASLKKLIHVKTGHGMKEINLIKKHFNKIFSRDIKNKTKLFFKNDISEINAHLLIKDN